MKVLYFNYLYDLQGISIGSTRKAEKLMEALSREMGPIQLFWRKSQPAVPGALSLEKRSWWKKRLSPFLHEPKQLLRNLYYFIEEFRILRKERPDLLIVRSDLLLFSAVALARWKKIPVIVEADAPCAYEAHVFHREFRPIPGLGEWMEKKVLASADHAVCVSEEAKAHFVKMGVPASRLSVVTNGADTARFHRRVNGTPVRLRYGLDQKTVIGFLGSFHYWHGIQALARIIRETLSGRENIAYLLIGTGGPMKDSIETEFCEEVASGKVIFTGYVPHESIPEHLAALDIVLAPYPDLPFFYYSPVKIFEYLACGKAVVSTDIGQIGTLIDHGENGLIYPPGDVSGMIEGIRRLIRDPDFRRKLGEEAEKRTRQSHSWNIKAREWNRIITAVTGRKSGSERN